MPDPADRLSARGGLLRDVAGARPSDEDLYADDGQEVRSLDLDVGLDMFPSEPARIPVPPSPSRGFEARAEAAPRQSAARRIPLASPWQRATAAMLPVVHRLRTIRWPAINSRQLLSAVLGLTAVGLVIWWIGTPDSVRSESVPPAAARVASSANRGTAPLPAPAQATPALAQEAPGQQASGGEAPVPQAPVREAREPLPPSVAPARLAPTVAPVPVPPRAAAPLQAAASTGAPLGAGWLRVESSVDLDISSDGRVVGTSRADRTMLPAGRYQLTFVNERLGYRDSRAVTIVPGEMRTLQIRIPNGMVSLNAQPWADVTIDGTSVGETPIGDLAMTAGVHEVVFTHPQLGQRRVEAVVRAGQHVRLAVDLRAQ